MAKETSLDDFNNQTGITGTWNGKAFELPSGKQVSYEDFNKLTNSDDENTAVWNGRAFQLPSGKEVSYEKFTGTNLPSVSGTLARKAVGALLPTVGGFVAGAAAGAPFGGVGAIPASIIGGVAGSLATGYEQEQFLKEHPKIAETLGQSEKQRALDEEINPKASMVGEFAPSLAFLRPSGALFKSGKGLTPELAQALKQEKTEAIVNGTLGAGIAGGTEAVQQATSNKPMDYERIAEQAALGSLGQKEWGFGSKLSSKFAKPTTVKPKDLLATPEPEPQKLLEGPKNKPLLNAPKEPDEVIDPLKGKRKPFTGFPQNEDITDVEYRDMPPIHALPYEELDKNPDPPGNVPTEQHEADPGAIPTTRVPVSSLKLSQDVPQFKADANEKGIVSPLTGKFDERGLAPIQVWQRNNGDMEVISGRHRFDLAQRSGIKDIPAQVYKESDGFTSAHAAALDAELNIRDNQGKVADYVQYFQTPGFTKEEARARGLLDRSVGQRAYAIATQGDPILVAAHRAGEITDDAAYAISKTAPNDQATQSIGLAQLKDGKSINNSVNAMQAYKVIARDRNIDISNGDLFGFDDSAMKEAAEMTKIAGRKQKEISERLSAISGASKKPEIAKAEGINVNDPAALSKRIEDLKDQRSQWERWSTNPDLVNEISNEMNGRKFNLEQPTEEELRAKQERIDRINAENDLANKTAEQEAATAEDRERIKQASQKASENFTLGQNAEDNITGQDNLFEKEIPNKNPTTEGYESLIKELRKSLDDLGLRNIGLKIEKNLREIIGGIETDVTGKYDSLKKLISLSLSSPDIRKTLGHEALHALRNLGFFTDPEWSLLTKRAENVWMKKYNIKEKYPELDRESQIEEAIAYAFGDRFSQPTQTKSILNKIKSFFEAVGNLLTGHGFKTAEDVFNSLSASKRAGKTTGEGVKFAKMSRGEQMMKDLAGLKKPRIVEPEKTFKENLKDFVDSTKISGNEFKEKLNKFVNYAETKVFTGDAALNNDISQAIKDSFKTWPEAVKKYLSTSLSQAYHADAVAHSVLIDGGGVYDKLTMKWKSIKTKNNFSNLSNHLNDFAKRNGLTREQAEKVAQFVLESRRLEGWDKSNKQIRSLIQNLRAQMNAHKLDLRTQLLRKGQISEKVAQINKLEKQINDLNTKIKYIHLDKNERDIGLKYYKESPELQKVVEEWNGIRENISKILQEGGLWSKEQAEDLLSYADYVPMFREGEEEWFKQGPQEVLSGLQVRARDHNATGSKREVHDVFDNMMRWAHYAVNRSVRNKSAQNLAEAAVEMNLASVIKKPQKGANNVRVWFDGKEKFYSMNDPLYMDAFNGLEAVAIPTIKFFSTFSNLLRKTVVLNPLFAVSQVPQDAFAAMFSSGLTPKYSLSIPARAVKEFVQTLRNKSEAHNILKQYGATGVKDYSSHAARIDAQVYAGIKNQNIVEKVKSVLENISMASDNAVRQAVYSAAIDSGLTKGEAIEKAFDVINFRRRGSSKSLQVVGQVVPFFNAYLAAQHVALKTLSGRGISPSQREAALHTLLATTGSVMALSAIYSILNANDPDYLNKPATVRDRLIMLPGTGLSIPLRNDWFTIPKIITEHMYLLLTDNSTEDTRKFRDSMAAALSSSLLSPTPVPQAIKPLIEVKMNYDFYQQRPLIGTFQKGLDVERQFNESTSELGKVLGSTGLVAPINADHLIRGMFGSVGGLTLMLSNSLIRSGESGERPSSDWRDVLNAVPSLSGFVNKSNETGMKRDFYILKDEVDRATATMNDIKSHGAREEAKEYLERPGVKTRIGMHTQIDRIGKQLAQIRKNIGIISNKENLSSDEKEEKIQRLKDQETRMLQNINIMKLRERAQI